MIELIQEAITSYNLPLTLLLGLVLLYWLLVIFGAMDFELDLFDFGDASAELPEVSSDGPLHHLGGAWMTAGRFIGFSKVPLVVWGSFFILFLWAMSLVLNHEFNPERSLGMAGILFGPASVGSLILAKLATIPVAHLFAAMTNADAEGISIIGRTGSVTTTELTDSFGQLQIHNEGAPVLINARLKRNQPALEKGDVACVLEASPDGSYYFVEAIQPQSLP